MRFKLTIAYRGTHYHGWQEQGVNPTWKGPMPPAGHGIPTIQEIVRRSIIHVVGHDVTLVGSSRTDAGVHAKGQLAHFDSPLGQIPPDGLRQGINARLPGDIIIRRVEAAPDWFDAIASTTVKRYQYYLWNAPDRDPFLADLAWHRRQQLNLQAMREAAAALVGTHDYASFARPGHRRESTVRTITEISLVNRGPQLIIGVEGTGFLWHMIRIIVGTLIEVGIGRFTPADMLTMLAARDRRAAGPTAPPHGLYLQWIKTVLDEEGTQPPR